FYQSDKKPRALAFWFIYTTKVVRINEQTSNTRKGIMNDPFNKAAELVKSWDNTWLATVWDAISKGGLTGAQYSNDIPVDDWIELVYWEMSRRGLSVSN